MIESRNHQRNLQFAEKLDQISAIMANTAAVLRRGERPPANAVGICLTELTWIHGHMEKERELASKYPAKDGTINPHSNEGMK